MPDLKRILLGAGFAFGVIQFIPVDRVNPPVRAEVNAPAEVKAVIDRSCYDCHSNETRWPRYSQIAPISWLVAHDVHEGREHLNFSEWGLLSREEQMEKLEEIGEEVEEGEMPLWFYLPLHPEARLEKADHAVLEKWLRSESVADSNSAEDDRAHSH